MTRAGGLDAAGFAGSLLCGFTSKIGRYPGEGSLISVPTVPLLLSGLRLEGGEGRSSLQIILKPWAS